MQTEIDVSLTYELGPARTALLEIEAARAEGQTVIAEELDVGDAAVRRIDGDGGLGRRAWIRIGGTVMRLRYRATVDVSRASVRVRSLGPTPFHDLPSGLLCYVRPSRFCQSDLLEPFASRRFGQLDGGAKVAAILDWISREMEYSADHSVATTTLLETFVSRKGVCRDYAHMMCGLLRASRIPARYVSAYGAPVTPPDFHAVVQVWLEGEWHLIDPSGMCGAGELVLIGAGRDAGDVPFMETPDNARLIDQQVTVTRK